MAHIYLLLVVLVAVKTLTATYTAVLEELAEVLPAKVVLAETEEAVLAEAEAMVAVAALFQERFQTHCQVDLVELMAVAVAVPMLTLVPIMTYTNMSTLLAANMVVSAVDTMVLPELAPIRLV